MKFFAKMESDLLKKYGHLRKILERSGPYDTENFSPSPDKLSFLKNDCRILVIGKSKSEVYKKDFII